MALAIGRAGRAEMIDRSVLSSPQVARRDLGVVADRSSVPSRAIGPAEARPTWPELGDKGRCHDRSRARHGGAQFSRLLIILAVWVLSARRAHAGSRLIESTSSAFVATP